MNTISSIRGSKVIQSILVDNEEIKLGLFADEARRGNCLVLILIFF